MFFVRQHAVPVSETTPVEKSPEHTLISSQSDRSVEHVESGERPIRHSWIDAARALAIFLATVSHATRDFQDTPTTAVG
ncbi:MAG: hypothetical protein AAF497_14635, partial [Planctomycetota bacterium]